MTGHGRSTRSLCPPSVTRRHASARARRSATPGPGSHRPSRTSSAFKHPGPRAAPHPLYPHSVTGRCAADRPLPGRAAIVQLRLHPRRREPSLLNGGSIAPRFRRRAQTRPTCGTVKGQWELPRGGPETCPLTVTKCVPEPFLAAADTAPGQTKHGRGGSIPRVTHRTSCDRSFRKPRLMTSQVLIAYTGRTPQRGAVTTLGCEEPKKLPAPIRIPAASFG